MSYWKYSPLSLVGNGRNRNNPPDSVGQADLRLATFVHMQYTGTSGVTAPGAWEIAVPNGTYTVAVGVGDESFVDSVHQIMRALPEVREPFWKTFVEVAKTNSGALRYIVMLMALYMHLGPFSKRVIGEIDRRIDELGGMSPVRATGVTQALPSATV